MKFTATRESFLQPLQAVIGVVERRQTMPILSNVLLRISNEQLSLTGTDLEVELVAETTVEGASDGEITVPGRKLHDICRALPNGAKLDVTLQEERLVVKAGRSRFSLSTLSAADFPIVEKITAEQSLEIAQESLHRLIENTQFSMAQQDVRFYLNGLLLETEGQLLRAVATDGHRLAISELDLGGKVAKEVQVIVPRKGVLELNRLLDGEGELSMEIGSNHIRVRRPGIQMTSKLIDGRFPEYGRVIPKDPAYRLKADREALRQALSRTAILSNEKFRGVRLEIGENLITMNANNPDQEEAMETVEVEYGGESMEIGFNVNYLLDALQAVDGEDVEIGLTDSNSSCLIRAPGDESTRYVVMPMRL